jgi:UDP-N-acetylmuramyl pentapeptide phosphotransferase/UDP-N-acetylglucosamine-1-phosphate transferase
MQMEVTMRERYIPPFIVLVAAAITSIINIINGVDMLTGLKRLLLVIVIFYIIGLVVKAIITKIFIHKTKEEEAVENPEEEIQTEEETN